MKICVCVKIIHDENEISTNADRTIDDSVAAYVISPYDCNAIAAAMNLAAGQEGAEVVVLTAGGGRVENSKMKKGILSRGPSCMYAVKCGVLDVADSLEIARALKYGVESIGGVDLVICGEGSGDMYNQQTGCILGALMDVPAVNGVASMRLDGNALEVERDDDTGHEKLRLSMPAVVSVTSDICIPKIPSMKDILAAGKKPLDVMTYDASEEPSAITVSIMAPESTNRKQVIVKGDGEEQIAEFYENIRKVIT